MPRLEKPGIQEALRQIRNCDRSMTKRSELGGDGQDLPFEQAFSNLAHAYMKDKAPSLLDHELGFQLLDRNNENTKAVGVFGFKVGSHLLFAPVFFLQGDLKGHELLYIKNQDMFVPLKEGWVNYILNRKPNILGDSVSRNSARMGVEQPDLNKLTTSPWKYASWTRDILPKMAATSLTDVTAELDAWDRELDLKTFCKSANLDMIDVLVKLAQKYPVLAREIEEHHGDLEFLHEAVKNATSREKMAGSSVLNGRKPRRFKPIMGSVLDAPAWEHPIKTGALKVLTYEATIQTALPKGLDEEDQERLLREGMLIKDDRKDSDVSTAYNVRVEQKLFNPSETGVYMILTKEREFKKCFVAIHPVGPNGRVGFATCVRLEGSKDWINCHPTRLWAAAKIEGEEYDNWFDSLSDRDSLPTTKSKRYMLVGPGRHTNATLPFRVEKSLGDERGGTVYDVDFSDHAEYRYAESLLAPDLRGQAYDAVNDDYDHMREYSKWTDGQRIHLDGKQGTKLRSSCGDVWIPEGYKLLSVEPTEADTATDGDPCCGDAGQSKESPIRPGNILDAELEIITKTANLKMIADRSTVTINDRSMNHRDAVIHLVVDHGFREKVAHELIGNAREARFKGKTYECRVKYAFDSMGQPDPYLTQGGPSAPGFPSPEMGGGGEIGYSGPTMLGMDQFMPVPGMDARGNEGAYRPYNQTGEPMDMDTIQQAMQTGQKEVFDTAMIGSMLKAVRDDTMIDRWLPDLIKGMDRLGRILFMFYWHGDKFADRYGKQDMPELEDTLRNAFEQLGDTILFLKQKTIEPYPEEDSVDLTLDD